jgi:hypothetical protein
MSITYRELVDSRGFTAGSNAQLVVKLAVDGSIDPLVIANEVRSSSEYAPLTYADLVRGDIVCQPQGAGVWFVDIKYGLRKAAEENVSEWSFTIDESSQHITHSLETINSYPSGAPDFKQAIGVTGDGQDKVVEGTDVGLTTFAWNETLYVNYRQFTSPYMRRLYDAQGCYNSAPFRVWAAGEVLLQRVHGSPQGQAVVKLDFSFAVSPNVTGRTIGTITDIDKKGWEHLWVFSRLKEDGDANELCPQPVGVYIERTRDPYNLSYLGLPDPFK